MKRWVSLVLILFGLMAPAQALALNEERIVSFDSQITIDRDNRPSITETIDYNFPSPRHGIFRVIPTTYNAGTDHVYYTSFKLGGVTDENGSHYKVSQSSSGGKVTLKIGDANKTITGRHTYKISYELYPLITEGKTSDIFNFDVTGNDWEVPIERVSAKIAVVGADPLNGICYTGVFGSKEQDCTIAQVDRGYLVLSQHSFAPGEGLTIGVDLPKGFATNYLLPNTPVPIDWWALLPLGLASLALLTALGYYITTVLNDRRHKKNQTIIAQYESPDGLSAAEIGTLVDDKSSMVEVTATLIDLAVKGYIKIEQTAKKAWFRQAKYTLTKLKAFGGMPSSEQALVDSIFDGKDSIELDKVDKTSVPAAISSYRGKLSKALKAKGYYSSSHLLKSHLNFDRFNAFFYFILLLFALTSGFFTSNGYIGGVIVLTILSTVIWLYARFRARLTPQGFEQWAEVKGFQLFLSVTEKDRLNFTDAPAKTPELFNKLLPYAVALGVEKQWAKQFEGINVAQATGWYVSPYYGGAFTSDALASDLSSGFSSSVSSGFAAPSSSSSGGGGSSGGGFGGGGGGSW